MAQRIPGSELLDPGDGPLLWEALKWAYLHVDRVTGAHRDAHDAYARLSRDGALSVDEKIDELVGAWVALGMAESDARAYVRRQREGLDRPGMRDVLRSHIDGFPRRLLESMYRPQKANHRGVK